MKKSATLSVTYSGEENGRTKKVKKWKAFMTLDDITSRMNTLQIID